MKLEDLQPLDEGAFRNVIAAATLAIASLAPTGLAHDPVVNKAAVKHWKVDVKALTAHMAEIAGDKYDVDPATVQAVVQSAIKHQYADFPKAKDLLAVVGVESSFNPNATSKLKKDPAKGLLQVRPGVWGLKKADLATIDQQIKQGADILHKYFVRFGTREAALHAFNVGPKNHRLSATNPKKGNPRYVPKVDAEEHQYDATDKDGKWEWSQS